MFTLPKPKSVARPTIFIDFDLVGMCSVVVDVVHVVVVVAVAAVFCCLFVLFVLRGGR